MLDTLRDRVGTPELVPKNVICKAATYPYTKCFNHSVRVYPTPDEKPV